MANHHTNPWPQDASDFVDLHWGTAGWSATTIAAELVRRGFIGCTKNSVVSKARRLGKPVQQSPIIASGASLLTDADIAPMREAAKTRTRAQLATFLGLSSQAVEYRCVRYAIVCKPTVRPGKKPQEPSPPRPDFVPVYYKPTTGKCLFPFGDPGTKAFRFCDVPRVRGSYCKKHYRLCHIPRAAA